MQNHHFPASVVIWIKTSNTTCNFHVQKPNQLGRNCFGLIVLTLPGEAIALQQALALLLEDLGKGNNYPYMHCINMKMNEQVEFHGLICSRAAWYLLKLFRKWYWGFMMDIIWGFLISHAITRGCFTFTWIIITIITPFLAPFVGRQGDI